MALETGTILVEPMTGGYLLVDHIPDKDKSYAKTFVVYKAIKNACVSKSNLLQRFLWNLKPGMTPRM